MQVDGVSEGSLGPPLERRHPPTPDLASRAIGEAVLSNYLLALLIDRTYAGPCHISPSVSTSRRAGMRMPLFSRPSAIATNTPLGSRSRRARLTPPLPS